MLKMGLALVMAIWRRVVYHVGREWHCIDVVTEWSTTTMLVDLRLSLVGSRRVGRYVVAFLCFVAYNCKYCV